MNKSSFYHTPLHSTPLLGGYPSEYWHPLWCGKTRMVSLPDGEKISKICLFVLTWSTNVTDGQTDGRTDTAWQQRPRLCIASRGNKIVCYLQKILNRNRRASKLISLKLGVCSTMNACYILYFRLHYLPYYAKTRTSNFRKVVWQHTEGMVLSIISILFKIYFPLHRNNETILKIR